MDETIAENLKFISTTHRAAFEQRQRYEWQMLIATLTFYVLTVVAVYAGTFRIPKSDCAMTTTFVISIALACILCGFLSGVHKAHFINKQAAEAAERAIATACDIKEVIAALPKQRDSHEYHWNWSFYWQCTVIILFASVSVLLIWNAPEPSPKEPGQIQSTQ